MSRQIVFIIFYLLHRTPFCTWAPVQSASQSPITERWNYLQHFAVISSAIVNNLMQKAFCVFATIPLEQIPRSVIARSEVKCVCTFARYCQIPIHRLCQQYMKVSLFPQAYQQGMLSDFRIFTDQIGEKWYPLVVLMCVSVILSKFEHVMHKSYLHVIFYEQFIFSPFFLLLPCW